MNRSAGHQPDWLPVGTARGQDRDFPAMALALLPCLLETVTVLDADGSIVTTTADLTGAIGYTHGWQGRVPFDLIHPDDRERVTGVFAQCLAESGSRFGGTFRLFHADGSLVHVEAVLYNRLDDPVVEGLVLATRNITELIEAQELLRQAVAALDHQASHDHVTGLPNRSALTRHLLESMASSRRDTELVVMYLDLDNFKAVNDSQGHGVGDEVLKIVALRLTGAIRRSDFVARIGGDEFVIVNHGPTATDNWPVTAERITTRLAEAILLGGTSWTMTASVGIVSAPCPMDPDALIQKADAAMYQAKRQGGHQHHFEQLGGPD
ncbi:MAG: diguanylate cyclase domain-containing protein [Acidimicrobiales bacterium]